MSKTEIVVEDGQKYEVEFTENGHIYWRQNEKLHRLNGPAIQHKSQDYREYWIEGERIFLQKKFWMKAEEIKQQQKSQDISIPTRFSKILGNP
jgi:hypothetical protein